MGKKRVFTAEEKLKKNFRVAERRRQLKQMAINYKGGKCVRCGYNKCPRSMEFHHLDPNEKDFGIAASGNTMSWENMKIELDKCVLICSNCHGEIHSEQDEINRKKRINIINVLKTNINCNNPLYESKKIRVECFNCKIEFHVFPSRIKAHKNIFCSRKCKIDNDQNYNWPEDTELLLMFSTFSVEEMKLKLKRSESTIYKKIRSIKQNLNILNTERPNTEKPRRKAKILRKEYTHKNKIIWPSDEELTKLVWEKPRTSLAKELGVSDSAIIKRCRGKNISMPERGYWTKIKFKEKHEIIS